LDTVIQAYKISESLCLPSMVCLDGVYLSYLSETVEIPEQRQVDGYLPPYSPTHKIIGGYKLYDIAPGFSEVNGADFMLDRYKLHMRESECLSKTIECDIRFSEIFGRSYPPVESYLCDDADVVLVMAGSAVGTAKEVINSMRSRGYSVGLVKIKMFRPFPKIPLIEMLGGKKKVLVIERDISPGQGGIFCQELKGALSQCGNTRQVYGFVSGLGGADITETLIEKAIHHAIESQEAKTDVIWLGLQKDEKEDSYDQHVITIQ
ncbi:MAG: hypothetical protein JRJ82_17015, partial [Deltaproteobacteria bacterium]|nr:hypothetical protein [Deltaproteobacteria bacterium]